MKPRNFPARKLQRQLDAKRGSHQRFTPYTEQELNLLEEARKVRTKKAR